MKYLFVLMLIGCGGPAFLIQERSAKQAVYVENIVLENQETLVFRLDKIERRVSLEEVKDLQIDYNQMKTIGSRIFYGAKLEFVENGFLGDSAASVWIEVGTKLKGESGEGVVVIPLADVRRLLVSEDGNTEQLKE